MRIFWGISGTISLILGLIGVALPLLPTVPFILLAAFCFSRSSERMHQWLVEHDVFGPPIAEWRDHGAISRKGKWFATLSLGVVFSISLYLGLRPSVLGIQGAVLLCVLIFIWTRPAVPQTGPGTENPTGRANGTE